MLDSTNASARTADRTIRPDDVAELRVLADGLNALSQTVSAPAIFEIAQRLNHIVLRIESE